MAGKKKPEKDSGNGEAKATAMESQPNRLSELAADPVNPRRIDPEAAEGLGESIKAFGDIAGIVFNVRTKELVSGHQRVERLQALYGDLEIVDGAVETPTGERFAVRLVDWDRATQRAANVAANNPHIAGEFTDDLANVLLSIRDESPDLMGLLRFDALEEALSRAAEPPAEFAEYTEDIQCEHKCPKCGYEWSGAAVRKSVVGQ